MPALGGELTGKGEFPFPVRLVLNEPAACLGKALAIALPLDLELIERMFEAGDGAERRRRHRVVDLLFEIGPQQHRPDVIAVAAEALARIVEI